MSKINYLLLAALCLLAFWLPIVAFGDVKQSTRASTGSTSATPVAQGMVGEVVQFGAMVSSSLGVWRGATTGSFLTQGTWLILPYVIAAATVNTTGMYAMLSDTNAHDAAVGVFVSGAGGAPQNNIYIPTGAEINAPLKPLVITVPTTVEICVRAYLMGNAPNPTIYGTAIRLR